LNAMGDWQLKHGVTDDPNANVWTAECYFQRAIAFRPNDPVVHLVYGIYLHKAHRLQDAERAYQSAEDSGAHSADYLQSRPAGGRPRQSRQGRGIRAEGVRAGIPAPGLARQAGTRARGQARARRSLPTAPGTGSSEPSRVNR